MTAEPLVRVEAGTPTDDELAAVVVALLATADRRGGAPAAPAPRSVAWGLDGPWVAPTSWSNPHR